MNTLRYWHAVKTVTSYPAGVGSCKHEAVTVGHFTGQEAEVRAFLEAIGESLFRLEELHFRHISVNQITAFMEAKRNLQDAEEALRLAKNGAA